MRGTCRYMKDGTIAGEGEAIRNIRYIKRGYVDGKTEEEGKADRNMGPKWKGEKDRGGERKWEELA